MRRRLVVDGLSRDHFSERQYAALSRELSREHGFQVLSPEARERSRRATLAHLAPGAPLWVFAYGSLMWNPTLVLDDSRPALLDGYRRRFCLWMPLGRGSPERPGLMLALERGGRCHGLALRIPPELVQPESRILWRREMLAEAYRPVWVKLRLRGGSLPAVAFVVNPRHARYAPRIPEAAAVRSIASAEGRLGRCRDYLANLVASLDHHGIADGEMRRLFRRVEAHRSAPQ